MHGKLQNQCIRLGVLIMFVSALSAAPALAGNIYSTGFEPTTYSTGTLSGQNGWTGSTAPVVENSTVYAGSQAVGFDSTGLSGQSLAYQSLSYNATGQTVTFSTEFMEGSSGTQPFWDVLAVNGNNGFLDQLIVANGNATLGLASTNVGSVAITAGQWNEFQLVFNFSTQTVSAYVGSTLIGSGAFANSATSLSLLDFGINNSNGLETATGYWDNMSVTAPEPGSLLLLATGLLGLAVLLGCKKRWAVS